MKRNMQRRTERKTKPELQHVPALQQMLYAERIAGYQQGYQEGFEASRRQALQTIDFEHRVHTVMREFAVWTRNMHWVLHLTDNAIKEYMQHQAQSEYVAVLATRWFNLIQENGMTSLPPEQQSFLNGLRIASASIGRIESATEKTLGEAVEQLRQDMKPLANLNFDDVRFVVHNGGKTPDDAIAAVMEIAHQFQSEHRRITRTELIHLTKRHFEGQTSAAAAWIQGVDPYDKSQVDNFGKHLRAHKKSASLLPK